MTVPDRPLCQTTPGLKSLQMPFGRGAGEGRGNTKPESSRRQKTLSYHRRASVKFAPSRYLEGGEEISSIIENKVCVLCTLQQ